MSLLDDIKRIKACNNKQRKKNIKPTHTKSTFNKIYSQSNTQDNKIVTKIVDNSQNSDSSVVSTETLHTSSIKFTNSFANCLQSHISESKQQCLSFYCNMVFCFPLRDIQLSKTRVQILSKLIKKHRGKVLEIQNVIKQLNQDRNISDISYYIILSCQKAIHQLLKQHPTLIKIIKRIRIINYQYISKCSKQNCRVQIQPYLLNYNEIVKQKMLNRQKLNNKCSKKVKSCSFYVDDNMQSKSELIETDYQFSIKDQINQDDFLEQKIDDSRILKVKTKDQNQKIHRIQQNMTKTEKKWRPKRQKFICQTGSNASSQFYINRFICEQLQKLQNIYENEKDIGRKLAYMKAVSAIRSYHKEIQSQKDIAQLRGIGKKILNKIKQLLDTGKIQKLQKLKQGQQNISCCQLTRVWGIGPNKAKQFYNRGIKTIKDLKQNQNLLSSSQRVGLKYIQQFQIRIKRQKAKQIYQFVRQRLRQINNNEDLHHIQICGSYRRGKQTCGDVDIIITRKDGKFQTGLLLTLVASLQQTGFLTDHLSLPSRRKIDYNRPITYMGVCMLNNQDNQQLIHHRIDIKYYPLDQYAYAILYFTGSDMFNRSMRLYARKLGYSLSDRGMCLVDRSNKQKLKIGENIAALSEKQIFQHLNLQYKQPHERNV